MTVIHSLSYMAKIILCVYSFLYGHRPGPESAGKGQGKHDLQRCLRGEGTHNLQRWASDNGCNFAELLTAFTSTHPSHHPSIPSSRSPSAEALRPPGLPIHHLHTKLTILGPAPPRCRAPPPHAHLHHLPAPEVNPAAGGRLADRHVSKLASVSDELAATVVPHRDTDRRACEARHLRARDVLCGEERPQDRRLPELVRRSRAEPFLYSKQQTTCRVLPCFRQRLFKRMHNQCRPEFTQGFPCADRSCGCFVCETVPPVPT